MDSERYVLVGIPVSSVLFTNDPAVVNIHRTEKREARERERIREYGHALQLCDTALFANDPVLSWWLFTKAR